MLVGDDVYGHFELNRKLRRELGIKRLCLHARRLQLKHPASGQMLTVEAPLPDDLKQVLDDIAADLGTPIRVEVHEVDDSTFTDIVTPGRPKLRAVQPVRRVAASIGEVTGDGFLPNEDVAVAVVVAHQVASTDGTARLRLPPALLEAHPGLVILMGQKSGAVMVSGGAA